jgi:hypothetical protein
MSYVMQNGSETFCIELLLAHKRIETPVFVLKLLKDKDQSERGKYMAIDKTRIVKRIVRIVRIVDE